MRPAKIRMGWHGGSRESSNLRFCLRPFGRNGLRASAASRQRSARTPITREGTAARSCCGRRECRGSPLHGEYCLARQSRSVRSYQKLALRRKGPARALPRRAAEETTRQATGEGERRQSQGDCCDERDMSHVRQNGRGQEKVPHGNEARCRNNQKAKPAEMVHRDGLLVIALQDEAAPNQVWPEEDERDAMRAEKPALHGAFPQRKSVPPRVAVPLRRGISAVW